MREFTRFISNKRTTKNIFLLAIFNIIYSLFILMVIEVTHRGAFLDFFGWVNESSTSFLITFLFIYFINGIFLFLPNLIFISFLVIQFVFWLIVALGSHIKFLLRGEYFTPSDVYLLNEGADISSYMDGLVSTKFVLITVIMIILLGLISYFFGKLKKKVSFISRTILSLVSLICIFVFISNPSLFTLKSYYDEVESVEAYQKYGFIGGFLNLWEKSKAEEPKGYSKKEVNRIIKSLENVSLQADIDPEFKPNIIVVLAEAVWDPLLLENITYSEDPIPYLRTLMNEYPSGTMLTHTYGGGTINTEMEVMTGMTTRLVPEERYYNHIVDRPVDSLAYVLRSQGYHTAAVHNFKNWYYARNKIYKQIGFEKFISMEFYNNPTYIGPFIDDRLLMDKALKELEQTEGPDFLDVVTVNSHGPYTGQRFDVPPEMVSGDLTKDSTHILNQYTRLLQEFDASIKMLIEGVEKLDEPTMVVIYGDHLPFLGEDNAVYREAEYIQESLDAYTEYRKMYETPLLVWNNFKDPIPKEDLRMTPNFVGSYILAHAKKEMSPIFQLNWLLYEQGKTVIPKKAFYQEENITDIELTDLNLLQYDAIRGNQFLYRESDYVISPSENYLLGEGKMEIHSAEITRNEKGNYILDVFGEYLVSNAKIYLNDKELETSFSSPNHLSSEIEMEYLESKTEYKVIVKLFDDRDTVIVETNEEKVEMKE